MNICLIRPPSVTRTSSIAIDDCPPIGLAHLAGSLRAAGHTVTGIDAAGEGFDLFRPIDLVLGIRERGLTPEHVAARVPAATQVGGVTFMFSSEWPHARRVLTAIRRARPDVTLGFDQQPQSKLETALWRRFLRARMA